MAPLRCALLGALVLAAGGSPIALARRLSGAPEACVQACPNVEAFAAAMEAAGIGHHDDGPTTTVAEEDQTTAADEGEIVFSPTPAPGFGAHGFVGTKALEAMQGMCQQQDVISCLEENSGVCGLVPEDFLEVKSHLSCVCDLCPGIVEEMVGSAAVLVDALQQELSDGLAGSPPEQKELEGTTCKLFSCMQCAAEHPAQCAFLDMQADMLDRRLHSMMGQMPSCPQDATCSASPHGSEPEAPERSESSRAGEISPRSLVASLLAVVVTLLVVAR